MSCCVYYKYRTQKRASISCASQYIGHTFECFHQTNTLLGGEMTQSIQKNT